MAYGQTLNEDIEKPPFLFDVITILVIAEHEDVIIRAQVKQVMVLYPDTLSIEHGTKDMLNAYRNTKKLKTP